MDTMNRLWAFQCTAPACRSPVSGHSTIMPISTSLPANLLPVNGWSGRGLTHKRGCTNGFSSRFERASPTTFTDDLRLTVRHRSLVYVPVISGARVEIRAWPITVHFAPQTVAFG